MMMKRTKRTCAIHAAEPAIPPKPSTAAISATIKKVSAQLSIKFLSFFSKSLTRPEPGLFFREFAFPEVFLRESPSWVTEPASLMPVLLLVDAGSASSLRRLLKNPHMSRCCQFSEDRKEPSAGRSRSATDKLGDIARAENWRNPKGVSVTCVGL